MSMYGKKRTVGPRKTWEKFPKYCYFEGCFFPIFDGFGLIAIDLHYPLVISLK
jgi:hypothetical protein